MNPRLLLCFGIAWIITNGWVYFLLGAGTLCEIGWMIAVGSGYLAFLWLPISPEKILTLAISIALLKLIFPNDTKTFGILRELHKKSYQSTAGKIPTDDVILYRVTYISARP